MGHRHLFSTSHVFESEHDQNWNNMHTEQPYGNPARPGAADNGSFFYPMENMAVDGVHFTSHWNPVSMPNGYTCLSHNVEIPHYQPEVSGPPHDHFMHPPTAGAFCAIPENYAYNASSSAYDRPTFQGIEGGFIDLTMGNGRGPYKRKSPGIPSVGERGSTSRYSAGTSSSDLPPSSEQQQEKPNVDYQHMPWDCVAMTPSYRGNGLSIRGEGSMRNVRSRPALELEPNLARTRLSSNHPQNSYSTNHVVDHPTPVDLSGQNPSALTREWSHSGISPSHGRSIVPDASGFGHETSHFLVGSSSTNVSAELGRYHDFGLGRNPVAPLGFHGASTQSVRGVRSGFSQRSNPSFSGSSSSTRLEHVSSSDEGSQIVSDSYSSRYPRSLSTIPWRSSDRNGRSRISSERYRSMHDQSALHDRFSSEGFMIVDRTAFYGSRNMFDQHRDMRLDTDNMTYEELLALGERIGNVSTGLSEDLMFKCLTETIYCSSDQMQEEGTCVICLEEYKDMDDVGTLKACGHDYHVGCIRKWLSMKKLCPICKASAVPDNMEK